MTSQHSRYFVYSRRVAYHETDAMGVLHHSNHVRYFEEARVEWMRAKNLIGNHQPYGPYIFAVTHQDAQYFKPAFFDEPLEVWVQGKMNKARVMFQYAVYSLKSKEMVAQGTTTLVPIRQDFKPCKLPHEMIEAFHREAWDLEWPPQA